MCRQGFIGGSERWRAEAQPTAASAATKPLTADEASLAPAPQPPFAAACHCGATRVEAGAGAAPAASYYCHCGACQQLTGADFAHNTVLAPDQASRRARQR